MSKGSIGIVVALIVFVVLLFVVIGQRNKPEKVGVNELKVEKLDKDTVTKIDVTMPPPKPDKADAGPSSDPPKHVIVEKDGASWKVYDATAPDKKFAVDDNIIKTTLDAVAEFAPGDPIANKKEKLAEYEIDDAKGTKLKVSTSTGKSLDLIFGRMSKSGGSTVRRAGSDEVFAAKGRLGTVVRKDVTAWRKKALFDIKADDITSVATTLASGEKIVVEGKAPPPPPPSEEADGGTPPPPPKTEWTLKEPATLPAGFRLDPAQLSRASSAVATLRAQDFADGVDDAAAGFKDAHTIVEATTKDGKKVVIHVGKEDDKKRNYMKIDGDPQIYLIANFSAKQLMRGLDDLRDLTLTDAKIEDVEKVTMKGSTGTIVLKKDGADWKLVEPKKAPDGFEISQVGPQIAGILRSRGTRLAADAPKDAVSAKASPTIEIALKGGKKQVLRFGEPLPLDEKDAAAPTPPGKKQEPREYYAKGGVDDLTYVVAAFTRNRYDKPAEIFKKPPAPPPGMGGPGGPGGIPGMEKLPPDVRKKLEESLKKGDLPPGHP